MSGAVWALFVEGSFSAALASSEGEQLSPKLVAIQAVCLDRLGHRGAAELRLRELEQALGPAPGADRLLALARDWIAEGRNGRSRGEALRADAMRFLPKISR